MRLNRYTNSLSLKRIYRPFLIFLHIKVKKKITKAVVNVFVLLLHQSKHVNGFTDFCGENLNLREIPVNSNAQNRCESRNSR